MIIDKNEWTSLVDYYCLQCDKEAKKKFSKYRPRCPKCKEKYDYRCISCEKLYGGYNTVYRHIKHECQNRFEMGCSLCNYTSTRKYLLLNHIKINHAIYKCLRCNCRCVGYISLRKHQASDCKIDNPHGTMRENNNFFAFENHHFVYLNNNTSILQISNGSLLCIANIVTKDRLGLVTMTN